MEAQEAQRVKTIAELRAWLNENQWHLEEFEGMPLLVNAERDQWIPFSNKAREFPGKKKLVVAVYKKDGEEFLLVALSGELSSNYREVDLNDFYKYGL